MSILIRGLCIIERLMAIIVFIWAVAVSSFVILFVALMLNLIATTTWNELNRLEENE